MPDNLTIASLSKLYDEINANAPPRPITALLPIQRQFNEVANMIHEQLNIPVYRSAWIGRTRGIKPRSAYKTRRGYKRALRYWRSWNKMMDRVQENVGYLFMQKAEDQMKNIMGIPASVFESRAPSSAHEARLRQTEYATYLRGHFGNTP